MINAEQQLHKALFSDELPLASTRDGFGEGILEAGGQIRNAALDHHRRYHWRDTGQRGKR